MVRNLDIFQGSIGWKQPKGLPFTLDPANTDSATGRFYDDFSALVNALNVYNSWTDFDVSEDAATAKDRFDPFLTGFTDAAVEQLFNYIMRQIEDLKQNAVLYPWEADFNHPIDNATDFVGWEIYCSKSRKVVNVINSVSATFDAVGTVKLLLFHSSRLNPVESVDITTASDDTTTTELNWFLDIPDGKYYLGYLTGGLVPRAYNRQFELANLRTVFNHIYFEESIVKGHNTETLFDVGSISRTSKTHGMNFDVSTYCDFSSTVANNKIKFYDAIGMQTAINCMDLYLNTTRKNALERITGSDVLLALEGNNNPQLGLTTQGLRTRLQEEVKELRKLFVEQPMVETLTLK